MRQLNKKQKHIIMVELMANPDIQSSNDLDSEVLDILERINDHETMYQNIDRYIIDYIFDRRAV